MANISINSLDTIQFVNGTGKITDDTPTAIFQTGQWATGDSSEAGILIDVGGSDAPVISPANARKLAKWLTRAADDLDGDNKTAKKRPKQYYDEDDDFIVR